MKKNNDFTIVDSSAKAVMSSSDDVKVVTAYTEEDYNNMVISAIKNKNSGYKDNLGNIYDELGTNTLTLTTDDISRLASNPQDSLSSAVEIGSYVRKFITKNDLIGKTYDAISNNVNTDYTLSYCNVGDDEAKKKKLDEAKDIIDNANNQINLARIISKGIPTTFSDGTYITYLNGDSKNGWSISYMPLGIAEITPYSCNGHPIVAINMDTLKAKMKPSNDYKDKNRKNAFYQNIEELVKNTYPKEVYDAYKNKLKYAILDYNRAGVARTGNLNGKYGISPIFRAFEPLIKLETYENSDATISKSKAKKIIFQKLNPDYFIKKESPDTDAINKATLAHDQLMQAWKNNTVIVTGLPWVDSISYVEPNAEPTPIETLNYNRNRIFTALGIAYLKDTDTSVTSGQLSVKELLKCINRIGEEFEDIFERYYQIILEDNGIEAEYAPKVNIIDSEQLEFDLKKSISQYLFQTLNCSYETAYNMLGVDIKDEYQKRKKENELGYEETFSPRVTSFTTSGNDNLGGRPSDTKSKNPDKQLEDKINRNKK